MTIKNFNKKEYQRIINSDEYYRELKLMSERIKNNSKTAPNEATIESYFDCELFAFFKNTFSELGIEYKPIKEKSLSTRRHISKGRADSAIGALIVEFKQPATFSNDKLKKKAISQISDYLISYKQENEISNVGFVTDGVMGVFVRCDVDEICVESILEIDFYVLDRLIQSIISLQLLALNSKNLVDNFCNYPLNDGLAFALSKCLYEILISKMNDKTIILYSEWKELFNLSHDDVSKQQAIIDRKKSLEEILKTNFNNNDEEYKALFAIQTAYAIVVKAIAYKVLSRIRYKSELIKFEDLIDTESDYLRLQMQSLEEGAIFRDYNITNLLEGDFFSWYCDEEQWDSKLSKILNDVFKLLTLYSDKPVTISTKYSQDFFKALYENMLPSAVRRSLGEYYTKKWIANEVISNAIEKCNNENWTGIDPCCGSGTFVAVMIEKIKATKKDLKKEQLLKEILKRVKGVDLNPVTVLTARVNYFINICDLISDNEEFEIPIYLGDSSYVPHEIIIDEITCIEYSIKTLIKPIEIKIPKSMLNDTKQFSNIMKQIELDIKNEDVDKVYNKLLSICPLNEQTVKIKENIFLLSSQLVDLEKNNWDGIWARIIKNFLITSTFNDFDIIVGNPPWVDWKSLPSGYRDRIKSLCISRKLFSGDRLTGGINLNICALIANVVADNWLSNNGVLAFLMPDTLLVQPSYEGFRNFYLSDDSRLYLNEVTNWTKSGSPFKPVTQKFLTYYYARKKVDYKEGVPVKWYIKKKNKNIDALEELNIEDYYNIENNKLVTCHPDKNLFTYINQNYDANEFSNISGECTYIGHEGIEFYPQELMLIEKSDLPSTDTCTSLINYQNPKSKYKVPKMNVLLETNFLHPMIKGIDIQPFHCNEPKYIVAFPYSEKNCRVPIEINELSNVAPKLADYYLKNKKIICSQTNYNEKIIGKKAEFYALARVGAYSFANYYVAFRDNSKWGAAVIENINTLWGGNKRPLFQNHAVSICEDDKGNFISLDEAHYICAILNAPITTEYVKSSSDSRSFPIRPRIYIPKYDESNPLHVKLSDLSKKAHKNYENQIILSEIGQEIDLLYKQILKK